jgi:hypothetical protein
VEAGLEITNTPSVDIDVRRAIRNAWVVEEWHNDFPKSEGHW